MSEKSNWIVIEYIEGKTLNEFIKINKNKLSLAFKIRIILNLMIAIEFIHSKNIIIRDLKYDNIVIDSDENAILIDFNYARQIVENNNENVTGDIGSCYFSAPEVLSNNMHSQKADIFSLGLIMHFIMSETLYEIKTDELNKRNENIKASVLKYEKELINMPTYNEILNIYKQFLMISIEARPNIYQGIYNYMCDIITYIETVKNKNNLLLNEFIQYLKDSSNRNNSNSQYILGTVYSKGILITRDIDKAIHYLTLSSNQNNSNAQYFLGMIYISGNQVQIDIDRAIHYFTLSSNQNNSKAQYYLGEIYYSGKYNSVDIDKAIYYLALSAKQNNSKALFLLGHIYSNHKPFDINRSIYYLTLSANLNNSEAQLLLGEIYFSGLFFPVDINKAIHFLTLSEQNNSMAQYCLGLIYFDGQHITRDIEKSIYYFTQSSNQYNQWAQMFLGTIYYSGEYVKRDINKAIHYLLLSSKQNYFQSQLIH